MDVIIREDALYKSEGEQVIIMENKYVEYINEHINFVKQSYMDLFYNNTELTIDSYSKDELRQAIVNVRTEVAIHDASKFSDDEFYHYRAKYYPTRGEQYKLDNDEVYRNIVEEKYNEAWNHHIISNNHHSEYWRVVDGHFDESNAPRDMELEAIIHMICDWEAMSRKFKTNTVEWYTNEFDKSEKHITPHTRTVVEELLNVVFKK